MTLENFKNLVALLEDSFDKSAAAYSLGIDVAEFNETEDSIVDLLLKEIYTPIGIDWFYWFCYDNSFGRGGLTAFYENNGLICQDVESLWKMLEDEYRK